MPIHFACPLCGKQTVVSDQYGGQTGPCAACGGTITIPLPAPVTAAPRSAGGSGGAGTMFVILAVLGVGFLFCCGGVGALFFLGRGQVQLAANRNLATNNLRQIGLALHNYHETYGMFPPAVVNDENGRPLYSGRVLLLPFMEQAGLFQAFDKSKAWDSPENYAVSQASILAFQDPANTTGSPARADLVFVTGPGTTFDGVKAARFADIHDGLSQTIGVVETNAGPDSWAAPGDWDASSGAVPIGNQPNRGLLVLFLDGSVQSLKPQYVAQNLRALAGIQDGQIVPRQP